MAIGTTASIALDWAAKARASGLRGLRFVCSEISPSCLICANCTRKRKACRIRAAQLAKTVDARRGTEHGIAADILTMARLSDRGKTPKRASIRCRKPGLQFPAPANPERLEIALQSLEENLVRGADNLILLLTPPFDKTTADVGYIKGYPPGVRENGGQYTHAAAWVAMAFARRGDGDKAVRLLRMLNPDRARPGEEDCERYKVEPYVIPGDIYSLGDHVGRGGWTWYTARPLGSIASGSRRFWASNVAAIPSPSIRSSRKIGLASICDTVTRRPFITSRLRILTTFSRCDPGGTGWNPGSRQNCEVA